MSYWLMKSEPLSFGIQDLEVNTRENGEEIWDGVRNYQAKNYLCQMRTGDISFFYHSNTACPGIYGLMQIQREQVVDPTQFDIDSPYFDAKSTRSQPRWKTVSVVFLEKWAYVLSLKVLKQNFDSVKYRDFALVQKGCRLSVMPVADIIFREILSLKERI